MVPLVTDLDDTLIHGDLLLESILAGLRQAPMATTLMIVRHYRAPQILKIRLAERVDLDLDAMPRNPQVEAALAEAKAAGRKIVLASGSTGTLVQAFAERFGEFDAVFASDKVTNLTSSRKAALLVREFGSDGFDYIGDTGKDIKVWLSARTALVARRGPRFHARLRARGLDPVGIGAPVTVPGLIAASLRPGLAILFAALACAVLVISGGDLTVLPALAGTGALLIAIDIYRMLTGRHLRNRPAPLREGRARTDHLIVTAAILGAGGGLVMAFQGITYLFAAIAMVALAVFGPRLGR